MDVPVTWPRLLETARRHGGQLWILPGQQPLIRESGQPRSLLTPKLTSDDIIALFWSMADEESKDLLKRTGEVQFRRPLAAPEQISFWIIAKVVDGSLQLHASQERNTLP
jgi:hypothetical protein